MAVFTLKYLYMSRTHRHIISQSKPTYEVSYAIIQKSTNAAFISAEIMEIDEKTKGIRQESEVVYFESTLAENQETERQKKTESAKENIQSKAVIYASSYV